MKQHYCGFCGKSQEEVERLLAGPCIEVCNECVDVMYGLMHEPKSLLPTKQSKAKKARKVIPFQDAARRIRAQRS